MPSQPANPPGWNRPNMIPTLNGTGFMFEVRDSFTNDFISHAGQTTLPVLELGCAYCVASIPALEAGAKVVASDMEPQHLEILKSKVPPHLLDKLELVMVGTHNYLTAEPPPKPIDKPPFMNVLDPDLMARSCTEAGPEVVEAAFIPRPDFGGFGQMDGRENAGVVAVKPG